MKCQFTWCCISRLKMVILRFEKSYKLSLKMVILQFENSYNAYTETKEWRKHLTIFTHTLSLKLWRAPIACEYRILWIFIFCNVLHVAISEELIAHNTATKSLRIIPLLGSSQIKVWTPQRAYRSKYDIWWTFTLVTSFMSQLRRNSSFIMTRNKFWLFHFANWCTHRLLKLSSVLSHVNNALCVYYIRTITYLTISDELDAHNAAWHPMPSHNNTYMNQSMAHESHTPMESYRVLE